MRGGLTRYPAPAPVPSIRSTAPNTPKLSNPDFKIEDLLKERW
jgi:hypothetical protein